MWRGGEQWGNGWRDWKEGRNFLARWREKEKAAAVQFEINV